MAFTKSTVGDATSGADYASDVGALQLWEDAKDGVGGEQEAEIITDIVDDCYLDGWAAASTIWIHGDLTSATKRKITTAAEGDMIIWTNTLDITSITIEDLELDGSNCAANKLGIFINGGAHNTTVRRVHVHDTTSSGVSVNDNTEAGNIALFENVITEDTGAHGITTGSYGDSATNTLKNCGAFRAASRGSTGAGFAALTRVFQNCLMMDNGASDFYPIAVSTTTLLNCVSSDTSATDGDHTSSTGCAVSKTSYTDYFTDWAGGDFTLKDIDETLWGINSDADTQTDADFTSVERVSDDIGPYDWVEAAASGGLGYSGQGLSVGVGITL